MPAASARAAIARAWPGTRTVRVSKNASVTTSTPDRRRPRARMAASRCTRLAIRVSPPGPW